MRLLDIKPAVVAMLKAKIPNINVMAEEEREEAIEKRQDITPVFFVELIPHSKKNINSELYEGKATVIIHYISKNQKKNEYYEMTDQLYDVFDMVLLVGDRNITIGETQAEISGNTLHFKFEIICTDSRVKDDSEYELMSELEIKEEL